MPQPRKAQHLVKRMAIIHNIAVKLNRNVSEETGTNLVDVVGMPMLGVFSVNL